MATSLQRHVLAPPLPLTASRREGVPRPFTGRRARSRPERRQGPARRGRQRGPLPPAHERRRRPAAWPGTAAGNLSFRVAFLDHTTLRGLLMRRVRRCFFACVVWDGLGGHVEAPRRPFGDGKSVVGISATSVLSWQRDGKTILDLQGGEPLPGIPITSPRPAGPGPPSQSEQGGGKVWRALRPYGEQGTVLLEAVRRPDRSGWSPRAGPASSGVQIVSGEAARGNPFRLRAMALHGDMAAGAAAAVRTGCSDASRNARTRPTPSESGVHGHAPAAVSAMTWRSSPTCCACASSSASRTTARLEG